MKTTGDQKIALISVYSKTGIEIFAQNLVDLGYIILSSGGTATYLKKYNIEVIDVAEFVGGKAILGHKVVTLSRELSAALLADPNNPGEMQEMSDLKLPIIDLVCVDCYPLEAEVANPGATQASVIEKTDIGGPLMIRASAKGRRIVICQVPDRQRVIEWLQQGKPDEDIFITSLVATAETYIAKYCLQSGMYHGGGKYYGLIGEKIHDLRYGENPQQPALGLFSTGTDDPLAWNKATLLVGNPGYVNWTDDDRALQTITHIAAAFTRNDSREHWEVPFIAIGLKHGNCCGAAISYEEPIFALRKMISGNTLSIFGGVVMTNFPITGTLADTLRTYDQESGKRLLDEIIAPSFDPEALDMLSRKEDACKIIQLPGLANLGPDCLDKGIIVRAVRGGFLAQENYLSVPILTMPEITYSEGFPLEEIKSDILLAWAVCATSNSNTITLVKNGMLIGNGVGQQDRVECCELSVGRAYKAGHSPDGAVACSDSFFPFADGPSYLAEKEVKAIFTTSGSIRDKDTIELCQNKGIHLAMIPNTIGRMFFGH